MRLLRSILLKKGLRSDSIWTKKILYREPFWRLPFYLDMLALFNSQYWSREEIEFLRLERIRETVREATRVPMWKETFEKTRINTESISPAQFQHLPITSKQTFAGKDPEYFTDQRYAPEAYSDSTSGSTGRPFNFFTDRLAELRSFAICERVFYTVTNDIRYPILSVRAKYKSGFVFRKRVLFYVYGYNNIRHRLAELVTIAKKYTNGFILYGFTSSIIEVARRVKESGEKLFVRAVVTTGEAIRDVDRQLVKEVFSADFFLTYATREFGWIGYECTHHNLHICEEYVYIEVVDSNGRQLPDGERGRVVVTSLDNRVMPFIRYEMGDLGIISPTPCPCGRTLKTLRLIGRQSELIQMEDSRVTSLLEISASFDAYSDTVHQYQIIQKTPLSFAIKIVPGHKYDEDIIEILEQKLRASMHPAVEIAWHVVKEIPSGPGGKAIYFLRGQ